MCQLWFAQVLCQWSSHDSCMHTIHLLSSRVLKSSNVAILDLLRFCCRMWIPINVVMPSESGVMQWERRVPSLEMQCDGSLLAILHPVPVAPCWPHKCVIVVRDSLAPGVGIATPCSPRTPAGFASRCSHLHNPVVHGLLGSILLLCLVLVMAPVHRPSWHVG